MNKVITANEVLVDLLEDNRRRVHRAFKEISNDCLHWSADGQANSIAVTAWHMGRLFDVFFTRQLKGEPAENERWFRSGWVEKTGYDPRGIGRDGWGSVNGYTLEEVAAIPRFTHQQLLGYLDDVYNSAREYIESSLIEDLQAPAAGFDRQYSRYQVIQMALMDNIRHLGEIYTLKSMWARQAGAGG